LLFLILFFFLSAAAKIQLCLFAFPRGIDLSLKTGAHHTDTPRDMPFSVFKAMFSPALPPFCRGTLNETRQFCQTLFINNIICRKLDKVNRNLSKPENITPVLCLSPPETESPFSPCRINEYSVQSLSQCSGIPQVQRQSSAHDQHL